MEAEAQPLLAALGLGRDEPPGIAAPAPAVTFSGSAFGLELHIVCNGGPAWPGIQVRHGTARGMSQHGSHCMAWHISSASTSGLGTVPVALTGNFVSVS